ncbi:MAG TPA: PQQ-binding-like beta-propeller repeat protein [Planctomycetota bacterium]|nr:PQQ-binding-like beta-propeller repeat protein [Planctomycetota bacterium]
MSPYFRLSSFAAPTLMFALASAASLAGEYKDPAPPVLTPLKPIDAPKLQPHPNVTFHAAPKPLAAGAVTNDWPWFLGPSHNMKTTETKILKEWPKEGPPLVWEMKRGTGYASPSILGDHLVYFHREGDEEVVECMKADTGERFWRFAYPTTFQDRYGYNNGPRASAIIASGKVYTYGAQGKLYCFDLATGQVLWSRAINDEFKVPQDFFGTATSPLLEGNLLIINVGAPQGPCVAAFDKDSGKMVWASDAEGWGPSYASPVPAVVNGKRRVYVFAGGESRPPTGGLVCLDPANGKVDFTFPWRSQTVESVNASCPVAIGNDVFISATYQTGGALLHVTPDFKPEVLWKTDDFGIHFMTAIFEGGYLYGFDGRHDQNSALVCYEVKSGKEMWRETPRWKETVTFRGQQQEINMGDFRGSLLEADGKFFCLGEAGHLQCWELTPKGMKEIARSWLFAAHETWTPLVLSKGLLYVVQNHQDELNGKPARLMCFDVREK